MKVIVGLGNPGKKYDRSRHNMGFLVVDRLAGKHGVAIATAKHDSLLGDWNRGGDKILLVKPQTYMNRSGQALNSLLRRRPLDPEDLVVIHDDLDLPFGRIRLRLQGSAGGNRGMLSILEALGDRPFVRLRIGIGRPPPGVDPADFVLQKFAPDEKSRLEDLLSRAVEAVESLLEEGAERTMEKFNRAG